jgi:putative transposase
MSYRSSSGFGSPRTVGKYMPKRRPGQPRGDQRWSTFLKNHAKAILACDFFVTFRLLYVFVVIEHETRRLAHVNVTAHPSADWTLRQLREVVGEEGGHRYLIMTETGSSPRVLMIRFGRWVSISADRP